MADGGGRVEPCQHDDPAAEAKRAARAAKRAAQACGGGLDYAAAVLSSSLSFTFEAFTVNIEEDWSGDGEGLAGLQWPGGMSLARHCDDRGVFPDGFFRGKRCLEVGAGCGLTGIVLALLGADVTITDLDPDKAVPNLCANLGDGWAQGERARGTGAGGVARLAKLAWGDDAALDALDPPFDVILAGDCCYQVACIEPLFRTLWRAAREDSLILLCGIVSDRVLEAFNEAVDRFFTVERLPASAKGAEEDQRAAAGEQDRKERQKASEGEGDCQHASVEDEKRKRLRALIRLRKKVPAQDPSHHCGSLSDIAGSDRRVTSDEQRTTVAGTAAGKEDLR